jgi:hypothetical protein
MTRQLPSFLFSRGFAVLIGCDALRRNQSFNTSSVRPSYLQLRWRKFLVPLGHCTFRKSVARLLNGPAFGHESRLGKPVVPINPWS